LILENSNIECSFKDFTIVPASNLLIRGQQKKRIEPQVMALLLLLINAKGQVVSRQQIRQSIWPDVIVGDEVITRLIFQLRNILADDAKNPQFIETIPKKGYLFIADVEFPSLNQANDAITGNETASATNTQQKQNILAISSSSLSSKTWRLLFLMTFLSLILMVIYNQINAPSIDSAEFSSSQINGVKPVTKLIGSEKDFAVSPNGQEMVFVHESSNSSELFLKNIQNMNSAKAITEDKWRPFSPIWINELTIAYIRHHNGQYQIVKHTLNAADMTKETILFESNQRIYTLTYLGPKHHKIIFNQKRDQTITELKALDLKHLQVSLLKDQFVGIPEQVYSPSYSIQSNQLYFVAITQGNDSLMALDYNTKQISLISEAANHNRRVT
jgi:DNA-binding winged helix-turn-helix (wHTH) protein